MDTGEMSKMKMCVIPLYDKILVEKFKKEEKKTSSGIILPNDKNDKYIIVKVWAVGEGRLLADGTISPLRVKAGDMVYCNHYAGTEIGENKVLIREDDVLGIAVDWDSSIGD